MARFRRKAKAGDGAGDNVDLSESEHAWWTTGRVQHAPGAAPDLAPPPAARSFEHTPPDPWVYTDVFAADVDGAIDRELGDPATASGGAGATDDDARSLAEVFVEESAFRVLGLEPGADWDEVVAAHRRMAKRCHPDRLISADDDTRSQGEQAMIDANRAYETLRRRLRPHSRTTGLFAS